MGANIQQLAQLVRGVDAQTPVWDGNLISSTAMSLLVALGLASKYQGFNFPTSEGAELFRTLKKLGEAP